MTTDIPNVTLDNGVEMPILGFGVYQIPPDDTEAAVATALDVGYRLIDTAAAYGNEEGVGRAVRERSLERRDIVTIPKSVHRDRMEQNLDVFDFALSDDEMGRIATLDTGASVFFDHRDPAMVSWLNSRRDT